MDERRGTRPSRLQYYSGVERLARIPSTASLWGVGWITDDKSVQDGVILNTAAEARPVRPKPASRTDSATDGTSDNDHSAQPYGEAETEPSPLKIKDPGDLFHVPGFSVWPKYRDSG